jgi:long-chain acyl-CoA synthetase
VRDSSGGNVADLVRAAADADADHPALLEVVSGRGLTWGALDAAVDAEARRLAAAGAGVRDRVVVRLPGTLSYCVAVFGALRAGCVVVPMAALAAPRELSEVLSATRAAAVIAAPEDDTAASAGADAGVRVLPPAQTGPPGSSEPQASRVESTTGGEDLAVLAFTSGTSGAARGVMLSHRALLANVAQCAELRPPPVSAADRVLLAVPLFHIYGLGPGLLQVAGAGATAVLAGRFDAAQTLDVIARYRVTTVVGVPPMYRAWLRLAGAETLRPALRTVRLLTSGAAPLDVSLAREFQAATGLGIYEGYGLTEAGPVLTSTLVGGAPKYGSVGRPIPGVQLRLVNPDGTPIEEDVDDDEEPGTGLVTARGENLFSGYWPDGDGGPDAEGWFRTSDVGFLDAEGDLHLVDRASDLIIVNGFNVYPHEVERVLLEHPAITAAGVIGMPDEDTGETVRAVLVLREGAELSLADLYAHCAARLARYKIPTVADVVAELPVTATGKLARRELVTVTGRRLS